jgi:hypothetical protein
LPEALTWTTISDFVLPENFQARFESRLARGFFILRMVSPLETRDSKPAF